MLRSHLGRSSWPHEIASLQISLCTIWWSHPFINHWLVKHGHARLIILFPRPRLVAYQLGFHSTYYTSWPKRIPNTTRPHPASTFLKTGRWTSFIFEDLSEANQLHTTAQGCRDAWFWRIWGACYIPKGIQGVTVWVDLPHLAHSSLTNQVLRTL